MLDWQESTQPDIGLDRKVRFLGSPLVYAEHPRRIESIETHFSWVLLTDRYVYKLKKPLPGEGFDFSNPAARQRNAEAEVRHRRLAPYVYLGVVPLTLEHGSDLAIGGKGCAVHWLVKMIRLPAARMLDRSLARGDLCRAEVHVLADRLARFFATARQVDIGATTYLDRLARRMPRQLACLGIQRRARAAADMPLSGAAHRGLIDRRKYLLLRRLEDGRPMEGHGDLRPEHIYLGSTPTVIDCLEFRSDLRRLDPVDELAFLDCARATTRPRADQFLQGDVCVDPCAHRNTPSAGGPGSRAGQMAEAGRRVPGDRRPRGSASRPLISIKADPAGPHA